MPEVITGVRFVDMLLLKKGIPWWIRFFGIALMMGGLIYVLNAVTTFFDSRRTFGAYNQAFGVPYFMQGVVCITFIFGVLAVFAGAGFLKLRDASRRLAVGLCAFKIFWAGVIFIIKFAHLLSKKPNLIGILDISATLLISVLFFGLLLNIFSRPGVKEEFV